MFKFIWKLIKWVILIPILVMFVAFAAYDFILDPNKEAREECYTTHGELYCDWNGNVGDKEAIDKEIADKAAKKLAEAEEKAKQERIAEERIAEEKRIKFEIEKAKAERELKEVAENKRKGFHCLSSWDGSHRDIVRATKKQLRDPKSFEHIETRVTPVKDFKHTLYMNYRAKNGFGGMSVGTVVATYSNASCNSFTIISID
jgi:hypothetical protein